MPTTLTNGIQLPDKGSVDWYSSMQSNYNLIDTHLGDTDVHVTAEDKANWNSKQGSLSQAQLDAIAQVATNTNDIATLQSGKADASHTHSSSDITDIGDYATKQYVDNSISGLVDNAPAALDTLNELSAALNDDSNFASTVTTALAAKADSADLATVATSGSYTDLTDKPTINDSTITIQKNGSTVDTFTTNGSNKTINIPVPTKTSDLTNDSNFVDTSNSAVSSGITSAKVTDYDTHIADTDIHVTTADKNKWNNQTYVFRYSSTALVASSTNSNSLLDNTDNLKVGDKVIDSSGVLFSITAIDTANSTFTIGTALIDLAQDSDVVHKTGNETVGGVKTFTDSIQLKSNVAEYGVTGGSIKFNLIDKNSVQLSRIDQGVFNNGISYITLQLNGKDSNNQTVTNLIKYQYASNFSNSYLLPTDNGVWLGSTGNRWGKIYGIQYYYGSNNVEFSTKFVTTDTAQTISGSKTFEGVDLKLKSVAGEYTVSSGTTSLLFYDKNSLLLSQYKLGVYGSGISYQAFNIVGYDSNNQQVSKSITFSSSYLDLSTAFLKPDTDNAIALGRSNAKWSDVQTYKVNGVEPSSLSLPDFSNGIDISSYITDLTGASGVNKFIPSVNGWVSIGLSNADFIEIYIPSFLMGGTFTKATTSNYSQAFMPVIANKEVRFALKGSSIGWAKFYPCQGNV